MQYKTFEGKKKLNDIIQEKNEDIPLTSEIRSIEEEKN